MERGNGDAWQQETKYYRDTKFGGAMKGSQPGVYKVYPDAAAVALPEPAPEGRGGSLWEALASRRSGRKYSGEPLSIEDLSLLLWSFNGVTADFGGYQFRSAPSAGALYPIETYIAANDISGVEPGAYHHNIPDWRLELVREGPQGANLAGACLSQKMCERAPVVFIWTAVAERSKWKYRQRAWRYIYLDAGHIGANLHIAAEALGLSCCMIGAFFDDEVNAIIGADGDEETVVYLASVGAKV